MNTRKLDFWIANNLNVLFVGQHGVGKTAIVKSAFEKQNFNWLYFSASTMDPWVDMIGVPKEKIDENNVSYIELVRPQQFAYDNIDAIFIDELNRAPAKVINAIMELIQFKSINGKKFNKLKIIWAAINPYNEDGDEQTYAVERLDPAHLDRFHVHCPVPYQPSASFFKVKYGECGATACKWWKTLSDKQKQQLSPRRLDYVLNMYTLGGDVSDVLPAEISAITLLSFIQNGSFETRYKALTTSKDVDIPNLLSDIGFVNFILTESVANEDRSTMSKVYPHMNKDDINKFLIKNLSKINSKSFSEEFWKIFAEDFNYLATTSNKKIAKMATVINARIGKQNIDADGIVNATDQDLNSTVGRNKVIKIFNSIKKFDTLSKVNIELILIRILTATCRTYNKNPVQNKKLVQFGEFFIKTFGVVAFNEFMNGYKKSIRMTPSITKKLDNYEQRILKYTSTSGDALPLHLDEVDEVDEVDEFDEFDELDNESDNEIHY